MDAHDFDNAIKRHGWKRRDRWHIDTGDGSLVRPGAVSRDYGEQLAFLLRRQALIKSMREEVIEERLHAGCRSRQESRRRRR